MAVFRSGARVKLMWKTEVAQSVTRVGAVGTVIRVGPFRAGEVVAGFRQISDRDCHVQWDDYQQHTAALFAQLAPATDCYDKSEWRECVWQPPHMRESA